MARPFAPYEDYPLPKQQNASERSKMINSALDNQSENFMKIINSLDVITNSSMLELAKKAVAPFGFEDRFNGLNEDATEEQITARAMEIGPGLDNSMPLKDSFMALVALSRILSGKYAQAILGRIRAIAYDEQSPHRKTAMEALSGIDPAADEWLKKQGNSKLVIGNGAENPVIIGTCGSNEMGD